MEEIGEKPKVRNSNLEILRIISMILILFHHFYYNNINLDYSNLTINQFIVQFLSSAGKIGVNCFILITGYFMIESKFKMKKLLKLYGQILFYSIVGVILSVMLFDTNIGIKDLVKSVLPISYNNWWFMTTYIIVYLLSNYINKFLKCISKKEYIFLMILLLAIWSIIPSFINGKIEFSTIDWFILLYMMGAYIKLYVNSDNINNKKVVTLLGILICLSAISILVLDKFYNKLEMDPMHFALPMNQILPLLISICLFIIFLNYKCNNSKIINKIASCTLGVYLIHTHLLLRNIIWIKIFKVNDFINSPYIVVYEIFVIIVIYFICTTIDYIRQNTIENLYIKLIDKIEKKYNTKYKKIIDKYIN